MDSDGDIDYSRYDMDELRQAEATIDRTRYPRNYANLIAAIESREKVVSRAAAKRAPRDRAYGCRQAVFRVLAAFIGIGLLATVVLDKSEIEPFWLFILGKVVLLVFGLFFLDVAVTGGLGLFLLIVLLVRRDLAGRYKYLGFVLLLGACILLTVVNGKSDALRDGSPDDWLSYAAWDIFTWVVVWSVAAALWFLTNPKK